MIFHRVSQAVLGSASIVVGICFVTAVNASELPAPEGLSKLVDGGAKWEHIHSAQCFTEGIASDAQGNVYFSDIASTADCSGAGHQEGTILKFDSAKNSVSVFRSPSGQSNGLYISDDGDLLVAQGADYGGRRISRIDAETGRSYVLAHSYQGRRLNSPNDLTVGPDGLIYFTDPRYSGHESIEQPIQGVYRIEQDGAVSLAVADAVKPNGLVFSPDGKKLYVAAANDNSSTDYSRHLENQPVHTGLMAILEYAVQNDGTFGARRILVNYAGVNTFGPDGLNVDKDGNIYAALFGVDEPGIYVYDPNGDQIGRFPTDPIWPTNTEFVEGPDGQTYLYMTGGKDLYRIRLK